MNEKIIWKKMRKKKKEKNSYQEIGKIFFFDRGKTLAAKLFKNRKRVLEEKENPLKKANIIFKAG